MRWRKVGSGNEVDVMHEAVKFEAALGRHERCLPQDPVGARHGRHPPSLLLPLGLGRPSSQRSTPISVLLVSTVVEATRRARMGCVHWKDHYDHARFISSRRTMVSFPTPYVRSPSSRTRNIQTWLQDEVHTCTMRSAYADSSRRPELQNRHIHVVKADANKK